MVAPGTTGNSDLNWETFCSWLFPQFLMIRRLRGSDLLLIEVWETVIGKVLNLHLNSNFGSCLFVKMKKYDQVYRQDGKRYSDPRYRTRPIKTTLCIC